MRNTDNRTLQPDQVKQVVSLILSSATHSLREISRVTGVSKPSVLKIQHRINILTAEQKEGLAGATGNEIMGLLYSKNDVYVDGNKATMTGKSRVVAAAYGGGKKS